MVYYNMEIINLDYSPKYIIIPVMKNKSDPENQDGDGYKKKLFSKSTQENFENECYGFKPPKIYHTTNSSQNLKKELF